MNITEFKEIPYMNGSYLINKDGLIFSKKSTIGKIVSGINWKHIKTA